ncbi:MAG: TPM domain-containing protein [Candidatus Taylorbacteria bacterium]|nr:TPM domain-containing protein [Candidatus Taylorbacteria bacterium]
MQVILVFLLFFQISFPKPTGFVNDFANVLPVEVEKDIEGKLDQYEKDTTIEIAVVTVSSLDGLEVEDYTQKLWESWGVGKRGKDNGLIFLVAPNERKVRIQTGYGIEPDLTDLTAGRILDESVVPFLKKNDFSGGIAAGTDSILKSLGSTPYNARLEERKRVEEERRRDQEQRNLAAKNFFLMVGVIILAGLIICTPIGFLLRYFKNKKRLQELLLKSDQTLKKYKESLQAAIQEHPLAIEEVAWLKKESPKEVWRELDQRVTNFNPKEPTLPLRLSGLGWQGAEEVDKELQSISGLVVKNTNILRDIKVKREEVKKAKIEVEKLKSLYHILLSGAAKEIDHSDVTEKTRTKIPQASFQFSEIQEMLWASMVNWITVSAALAGTTKLLKEAISDAQADKVFAQKARQEGPELFKNLPQDIEEAKRAVGDSDVSGGTRQKADEAQEKYSEVKLLIEKDPDWVPAFPLLLAVAGLVSETKRKARQDKDDAERARRRRREQSSSSLSSSRSRGFSGFGGGRSGGGGASRGF